MQGPTAFQLRNPYPPVLLIIFPAQGQGRVKMQSHVQLVNQNHAFTAPLHSLFRSQTDLQGLLGRMFNINGSVHRVALIPDEVRRRPLAVGAACRQTSLTGQPIHHTAPDLSDKTQIVARNKRIVRSNFKLQGGNDHTPRFGVKDRVKWLVPFF